MSQWTNFRDAIEGEIENVKLDELAKQELTKKLVDNVMPAVDAWVDKLSAGLTEEAKEETGWCKIRDGIVLPYVLKAIMYIGKQALERTLANTVKEA
ncbi:hypothetical protein [uncultured Selenomonas sp.]|uniref:hypothetical protein n=1 Tax=uncultured Selenomonas sp. TaxID=159275 RepID=UPI0025F82D8A|nr:hypothetical protein [uncultured Selenomonas sp.]